MSYVDDEVNAVLEEIKTEAAHESQLEPIRQDCRRFARQLWHEHPNLSVDEILESYEIKEVACKGNVYERDCLLGWILPDITPHQELDYFHELPLWKLEEAVALWLDINPFILLQTIKNFNSGFWHAALHPNFREKNALLLEKAQRYAISGQLPATKLNDQYWVAPKDFHEWATKNTEAPDATRIRDFFARLEERWNSDDRNKKGTKVEGKIKELRRILEAIKTVDPEFDLTSMPGRKEDFHNLCIQLNKPMFSIARATFNDYLLGTCSFNPGARPTDYYASIASKLG